MKKVFVITLLTVCLFSTSLSAKIWINEFMQSNIDFVRDDLQEFPDSWIELYNDSNEAVNIQNWTISDDANYQRGWKITKSTIIPQNSYLLIYADKASKGLHTHFRLESGSGGAIYLFDANGLQIDAVVNFPKQPAPNIARGRISDGHASWAYFVTATPGSKNTGKTSNSILPQPVFSQTGGIFNNTVYVCLYLPTGAPNGVLITDIHYTLDNTEPTIKSPSYRGEMMISKTTVLRAKLIHPDYLSDRSKVHSYIITKQDPLLPVIAISTDPSYLWDEEFGIYCKGNGKYGLSGNGVDFKANWNNDWRRPINFEYFTNESNSSVLNQLCEFRIAGGWSRGNPQKSFVVYGNKRFGVKRFEYDIFKEKPNQEIKSFMIRNSGNDFWWTHFRDAAIQLFMGGKVNIDYQAYQPAIFYLNGNYWGIQNLRERSDEDFVLANYATEDIDMFENWGDLKAGDWNALNQLMNELIKSASQQNFKWIMDQIDIDEFINLMILQIYVANTDFLSDYNNNIVMWRPHQTDGKWRFILKDMDQGLGIWGTNPVTYNAFNRQYNNDTWKLYNALLTQDSFKKEFYSRFAIYMGDILHYKSTSQVIDSIQKLIESAMQDHLTRWMPEMWWRDMNSWRSEVTKMKTWCSGRNAEVYKQLVKFFQLGDTIKLEFVPSSDLEMPPVFINGIRLRNSGLNAYYFQKEDIKLHYEGKSQRFGWEIIKKIKGIEVCETIFDQDFSFKITDDCNYVRIRLVNNPTSLTSLELPEIILSIFDNQLQISNLQLPSIISIYDLSGKIIKQTATTQQLIVVPFRQKGAFIVKIKNDMQNLTQKVIL